MRAAAKMLLGFAALLVLLYWGLNTVENGISELLGLKEPSMQAFRYHIEEKEITILFAGRFYHADLQRCLDILANFFPGKS